MVRRRRVVGRRAAPRRRLRRRLPRGHHPRLHRARDAARRSPRALVWPNASRGLRARRRPPPLARDRRADEHGLRSARRRLRAHGGHPRRRDAAPRRRGARRASEGDRVAVHRRGCGCDPCGRQAPWLSRELCERGGGARCDVELGGGISRVALEERAAHPAQRARVGARPGDSRFVGERFSHTRGRLRRALPRLVRLAQQAHHHARAAILRAARGAAVARRASAVRVARLHSPRDVRRARRRHRARSLAERPVGGDAKRAALPALSLLRSGARAIESGIRRIHLGPSALYPKVVRGARLQSRLTLVRGITPAARAALGVLAPVTDMRNRAKQRRLLGTLTAANAAP